MAIGKEQPAASYDSVNIAIERARLLRNSEHLWRPGHRHPRVTAYRSASRIGWLEGNVPCAQTLKSLQVPLVPRFLTGKLGLSPHVMPELNILSPRGYPAISRHPYVRTGEVEGGLISTSTSPALPLAASRRWGVFNACCSPHSKLLDNPRPANVEMLRTGRGTNVRDKTTQ